MNYNFQAVEPSFWVMLLLKGNGIISYDALQGVGGWLNIAEFSVT